MSPEKTPHIWSKEALSSKAELYAEEMHERSQSDWQFGFWSSLTLEMLLRASVATISPSLLADGKDWSHLLFATGRDPNVKKYVPKSIEIRTLLPHIENTFPAFTKEMLDFCITHTARRNSEVHSGDMPFEGLGTSSWLPRFYQTCECLLQIIGTSLDDFFGTEVAESAREHIQGAKDEAAKTVKQNINAHKTIWTEKEESDRESLQEQAKSSMTRYYGHRVKCPACDSDAALHGSASGPVKREVDEDGVTEKQSMLPSSFECMACGLKISGYSKLIACGLGDVFVATSHYDPVDFFNINIEEEFQNMMGEDNNEPF